VVEPLEVSARGGSISRVRSDLIFLPVLEDGDPGSDAQDVGARLGVDVRKLCRRHHVRGARNEALFVPGERTSLVLIGLGASDELGPQAIREAAQRAGIAARPFRHVVTPMLALAPEAEASEWARALCEGFAIGNHRFDGWKSESAPHLTRSLTAIVPPSLRVPAGKGMRSGALTAGAVDWARDLTDMAPSIATPAFVAGEAAAMAAERGIACTVWDRAALEQGGFGGILAVGRGGANEAHMVELTYRGGGPEQPPIAITGKGVTFDSGGLNLKEPDAMSWMRSDMAGAAAALATVRAAADLGLAVNVVAAIPLAENIPGPDAYRPGDVIRHRGGRTSEVCDTDSEGRVLLADALAYLSELHPALILDSATLTDAAGLGLDLSAVMGNDEQMIALVLAAGEAGGERGWPIPLWNPYRTLIDSKVADVKNLGSHDVDSAMMAGLFLETFVPRTVPWVHLDIGSSAWAEFDTELWGEGATGAPTRAFIRSLESLADDEASPPRVRS
jgi:leucyl aminopeptidase